MICSNEKIVSFGRFSGFWSVTPAAHCVLDADSEQQDGRGDTLDTGEKVNLNCSMLLPRESD